MSHRGLARAERSPRRPRSHVLLLVTLTLLLGASTGIADPIAFFDLRRVFAESRHIRSIQTPFEARLAQKQKDLTDKQQALRAAMSSPAGGSKGDPTLVQDIAILQKELTQLRLDLEKAIRAAVEAAVAAVAKERGLTIVLDKRFVFHGPDAADVTARVLEKLDGATPAR